MTYSTSELHPLIDDQALVLIGEEGFHRRKGYSLFEDAEYIPKEFNRKIKPMIGYAGGKSNLIYKHFVSKENVFFPNSDASGKPPFDYYVSLFGGSAGDITLVASMLPEVKLVLNELNKEVYSLYVAVRDHLPETLKAYQKLIATRPRNKSAADVSIYYKQLKDNYCENYAFRKVSENSAMLMFLLQLSFSYMWGNRSGGQHFYNSKNTDLFNGSYGPGKIDGVKPIISDRFFEDKVQNLKNWNRILKTTQLWSRSFEDVPLPRANALIYCDPPYFETKLHYGKEWGSPLTKSFTDYFNKLNTQYGEGKAGIRYYLAASNNDNPVYRSQFKKKDGWNSKSVGYKYSVGNSTRGEGKQVDEVLITNYTTDKLKSIEDAITENYTNAYVYSFDRYVKTLL